jgi:1-phosphatidylinositol-4-phosphate 5-kinase
MVSNIKDANIFKSFNINENIGLVKEKAYSDGGKSGEFIFGTFDNKFIIKTITEDEAMLYL